MLLPFLISKITDSICVRSIQPGYNMLFYLWVKTNRLRDNPILVKKNVNQKKKKKDRQRGRESSRLPKP